MYSSLALIQLELDPPTDLVACIARPSGSYDPSRKVLVLIPNFEGVFEGILEFSPSWAGEFDSFVVIATCTANDEHHWEFRVLLGDDWASHKEAQKYRHAGVGIRTSYRRSTLQLPHLYDEGRIKTLVAEARRDPESLKTGLTLNVS
jgi:hypothetical protein